MISEKMAALGKKRSVIREIFEYAKQRSLEIGAENIFDFSIGNPNVPAPQHVAQTVKRLISEGDPVKLHGYTSAQGDLSVRKAMAESICSEVGIEADPNLIYMTCGAAASLTISLAAILLPGEEVVVPAPFFPEYTVFVEKAGGTLKPVECLPETFMLDFEKISAAINEKTKAVILNSPNNPTGAIIPEDDLKRLAELLKLKQAEFGTEIFVISDEPYRKLVYSDNPVPDIANYYDRTLICYSFSKSLSLPGERIGYICVNTDMPDAQNVYAAVCGAGRALGFVCAPSLMQFVVAECAADTADTSIYRTNRDILYNALSKMGYSVTSPDGAFYLFVKALEPDAYAFCEKAKQYELLLVPSDDFGYPGYVRIAYCTQTEMIERSLSAFEKLIKSYN